MTAPVESLAHYAALVKEARTRRPLMENALLLPGEAEALAAAGRLSYVRWEGGLAVREDRGVYARLHLWADPERALMLPGSGGRGESAGPGTAGTKNAGAPGKGASFSNKPLLVVLMRTDARRPPLQEKLEERLLEAGFRREAVARRMAFAGVNLGGSGGAAAGNLGGGKGAAVVSADKGWESAILELWRKTFDPVVNQLPDRAELRRALSEGRVLAAVKDGALLGALMAEFGVRYGWIWHQAVDPGHRGAGVGRALSLAYFDLAARRGIARHRLFVVDGTGAEDFHRRFGFERDGTVCEQYILRPGKISDNVK